MSIPLLGADIIETVGEIEPCACEGLTGIYLRLNTNRSA